MRPGIGLGMSFLVIISIIFKNRTPLMIYIELAMNIIYYNLSLRALLSISRALKMRALTVPRGRLSISEISS